MNGLPARQNVLGDGDDGVGVRVGGVNHGQLSFTLGFGVVFGLAIAEVEGAFAGEQVGEELAEQQKDQPAMDHPEADLARREGKAPALGGDEVDKQHPADEVAAREDGDSPRGAFGPPIDEEAAKEFVLGLVKAQVHLGARAAGEDQDQAQRQAHNRQAQRREEVDQAVQKIIQGHVN